MMVSEKLATFITATDLDKMPGEVITLTKRAMIDTLGVALAGSVHPAGKAITGFVQEFRCRPDAGVIGSNIRSATPLAALANGIKAHVLDYDDVRAGTQGHPSAVLIPVVLAVGEERRASGKEIIEAYVLGLEIWSKISGNMPELHLKGWHPSGVLGTVGAAIAAAKLLKLTREQTTMALGIACSQAAGLIQNFGTMTKSLHVGNAAKNGILAALLAKEGFTSSRHVLDGDAASFLATFLGSEIENVLDVTEELGRPFALIDPGVAVKKYLSCYGAHRALDALLYLIESFDIRPEEVEAVTCTSNPVAEKTLCHSHPTTALEAKFSMQYAMAVALIDRQFGMAQATDEKVKDPLIRSLMKKVTFSVHPDWAEGRDTADNRPDVVDVRLKDGREFSREVLVAKGASQNPLSEEELLRKYRECAKLVLTESAIEKCIELVWELDTLGDVRELMEIVSGGKRDHNQKGG